MSLTKVVNDIHTQDEYRYMHSFLNFIHVYEKGIQYDKWEQYPLDYSFIEGKIALRK